MPGFELPFWNISTNLNTFSQKTHYSTLTTSIEIYFRKTVSLRFSNCGCCIETFLLVPLLYNFFFLSPSQFWFLYSATSNIYQIPFPFCRKHAFVSYSFSLQHRKRKRILISYSIISVKYKVFHSYTVFTSTTLPRLGYSMKYLDIHVDLINITITLLLN